MTARSLELIASADAIFHDRLIPPGALDGARGTPRSSTSARRPAGPSCPRMRSSERLIEAARAGQSVVRLKGGDPFVFGRGGEEGETLRAPGSTSRCPRGHRGRRRHGLRRHPGHPPRRRLRRRLRHRPRGPGEGRDRPRLGGPGRFPGTLVFYMGVKRLADNTEALIAAGRDAERARRRGRAGHDAASARSSRRWGPWPRRSRQGSAPARSSRPGGAPRGARLARRRPLHGQRVVVTRARAQASGLAATCAASAPKWSSCRRSGSSRGSERRGARGDRRDRTYALVCVTSPNGARPALRGPRGCGPGRPGAGRCDHRRDRPWTAAALAEHGIVADVVPSASSPRHWSRPWPRSRSGRRVLVARAAEARDVLPDALRERGAQVDVVALYETVREARARGLEAPRAPTTSPSPPPRPSATWPSARRRFPPARVVSIGPVTSEAPATPASRSRSRPSATTSTASLTRY